MNVLEKIKKMQKERGWTTYKLAYEACLTQSTLSNMFARGTCPTVDDAFGITLSEFFETNESKIYVSKEELTLLNQFRTLNEKEKAAVKSTVATLSKNS